MPAPHRRAAALLSVLAFALGGCAGAAPRPEPAADVPVVPIPPLPAPAPDAAPRADDRAPGLSFGLREGGPGALPGRRAPVSGAPLSGGATAALLARLPALPPAAEAEFRLPPATRPPPRAGATIAAPFPPPAGEARPAPAAGPRPAPALEVVRVSPAGETPLAPHLTVVFSRAMVPLTSVGVLDRAAVPARLSPRPAGRWSWIDPTTLRFEPEGRFPMATAYVVEVPSGTRSADGTALAAAVRAEFSTPAPVAVGGYPHAGGEPLAPSPRGPRGPRPVFDASLPPSGLRPVIVLVFDQRVDADAVLASTELLVDGARRRLRRAAPTEVAADTAARRRVEAAPAGRWVALRPAEPLPRAALVRVRVGPGTRSAEGPRVTEVVQELTFRTYGPLVAEGIECAAYPPGECPPGAPWRIRFSNPLDTATVSAARLRVEPWVEGLVVEAYGADLVVRGETRAQTRYTVTLDPGLRDVFGQAPGEAPPLTVQVGDPVPLLALPGAPLLVLDPAGPREVRVHARGMDSLRVRVLRVRPEQWPEYGAALRRHGERRGRGAFDPPGEEVVDRVVRPDAGRSGFSIVPVDVGAALRDGLGHAIVVVEPAGGGTPPSAGWRGPWPGAPATAWVQATRIGLSAMVDGGEMLGWATSLVDGAPLAGIGLRLHPSGIAAETGAEGLASLPLGGAGDALLVARRGGDAAFLPEQPYPHGYGEGGWRRQPGAEELRWLVFTDRGLYRPGEEVRVRGWVRAAGAARGFEPEVPRGLDAVALSVDGPRREEIARTELPTGALGGFTASFRLPEASDLGHAALRLEARGAGVPEAGRETWHGVAVQEFRRPDYEVAVEADPGPHLIGGTIDASLRAAYYSGGGLPGARVEWRVHASPGHYAPPGWEGWHFGRAPGWGPWSGGEEFSAASLLSETDAAGTHRLRVDLHGADPPFPSTLRAEAEVSDVDRRAGSAGTDLLVHPAAVYAGMRLDRRWVDAGDSLVVHVVAVGVEGEPAPGRTVVLGAARQEWSRSGGWEETDSVGVCRASPGGEPARCVWRPARGGSYRLRAEVRDAAGRVSRTELPLWVAGGAPPLRPDRPEAEPVEIVPDREEYQPGDTAVLLVRAPFAPAEGVLTLRRAGLLRRERFRTDAPTLRLRVPITEAHLAGVSVRVDLVGIERGTDLAAGEARLSVPPRRRGLRVRVAPLDRVLEPGGRTTVEVEVRDAAGRPAAGAEVALWMVDEAVLAIGGYALPDPLAAFYPDRSGGVFDHHLRPWVALAPRSAGPGTVSGVLLDAATGEPLVGVRVRVAGTDLEAATGEGGAFTVRGVPAGRHRLAVEGRGSIAVEVPPGGIHLGTRALSGAAAVAFEEVTVTAEAMNAAPPPAPPMMRAQAGKEAAESAADGRGGAAPVAVRADFAPLALFEPALRVGPDGRVRVPVRLPESLTRYRVMAVAVQGPRLFGTGEAALTARRELMVRPSVPRFLHHGDRIELPVVVQNGSGRPLEVEVAVRAAGLRLDGPAGRRVTVPANDRAELRFPASAVAAGEARVQVVAAAGALSDAAEVALPVHTPATAEAFAAYGEVDDDVPVVLPVDAPEGVLPGYGGLELTLSSTALQELTDAVLYLRAYPFEGTEQLASRVLGIAGLRDVLEAFRAAGLPPREEVEAAVRRDLAALAALQGGDGGWGYWRPDEPSDPFVSVHAAHALQRAREAGYALPGDALERAAAYLRALPGRIPEGYGRDARASVEAYALYVRERMEDPAAAQEARRSVAAAGAPGARALPVEAAGWLLHVLAEAPSSAAERAELIRLLEARVTGTAAAATFVSGYEEAERLLLHSERRSDAVALEALIAADPRSDLVPKVARGLLGHRVRGRWRSTQENAWVLLALGRYFRVYEGTVPDLRAAAWLGGRYAGGHDFEGRTTERFHLEVPMREVARAGAAADLTLQREGEGRLYWRAGLRYAPADLRLDALERGFAVERAYEAVDDPADVRREADGGWRIRAGARVRVRLSLTAPARRQHVALVDPLPAGLEPVNPELRGTGFVDAPPPPPGGARRPGPDRFAHWFVHQNLRDDRAEAFATLLPAGRYDYAYLARATTPGVFVVPPPRAEEMYRPETFGRGATARVVVEEGAR